MDRFNQVMALHAVGSLDLQADERALDLGFGSGVAIELMLGHEPSCRVIAVDPSDEMLARARKRFARELARGSLVLHRGQAESLPLDTQSVDAALSNNTVYFWRDLGQGLGELHRVLRPGGRVVLGINPPAQLVRAGFVDRGLRVLEPDELVRTMENAGFTSVHARRMPDPGDGTVLIRATRE